MPGAIVVVGSLHHDIIVQADRQPLRGETLMGTRWFPKFGGKGGNQACACARLGAHVDMIGAVGDDAFGQELRKGLRGSGVGQAGVASVPGGSGMSVAVIDEGGDYAAVVVTGANARIDREAVKVSPILAKAELVILQNEVPEAVNLAAAEAARNAGARVVWNAAPMRPDTIALKERVDVMVVNAVEAEQLNGLKVETLAQAHASALALRDTGTSTIVTAGAAGFAWASVSGADGACEAEPVANPHSHGAGDVFTGALAVSLASGADLAESALFAGRAARRHVSGKG